jgi:hypothetical protein
MHDDWPELRAYIVVERTTVFGCDRVQIWTDYVGFFGDWPELGAYVL